jgi:hypothetical protein
MRNTSWKLRKVKDRLIKDLKESTLSFAELGRRYGVSRQAIFGFCQRKEVKRPRRPKREHTKNCLICQSIIRIAEKPHSDFISSRAIKRQLKPKWPTVLYHIGILRKKGLISPTFGRLQSQKVARAYQLYFTKRLPVSVIGRRSGLKNFHSIIQKQRAYGWYVPAPIFKYYSNDRRKTVAKRIRKKKRSR